MMGIKAKAGTQKKYEVTVFASACVIYKAWVVPGSVTWKTVGWSKWVNVFVTVQKNVHNLVDRTEDSLISPVD